MKLLGKSTAAILVCFGLGGRVASASFNLILNGSFEDPQTTTIIGLGNDNGSLLPHWTSTTSDNTQGFTQNYLIGDSTSGYSDKVSDGHQAVMFNGDGLIAGTTLSQSFATTPGNTYTVTFDLSRQTNANDPATIPFSVALTGNSTVTLLTPGGAAANSYVHELVTFVATVTNSTLTFSSPGGIAGVSDNSPELDNVVVTPEPASIGALALTGLFLGARRRR